MSSVLQAFLSRPTRVEPAFAPGLDRLLTVLDMMGVKPRTVGTTDIPIDSPLDEVIRVMRGCAGAIVVGVPQIHIESGTLRGAPLACPVAMPTEWNHIEAALAHSCGIPLLVLHHNGIGRGIFDRGAIPAFLHAADFADPDWPLSSSTSGALRAWQSKVLARAPR